MKKIIALLLSLIMMFTFVACSSSKDSDKKDDDDDKKTTVEKAEENDEKEDKEDKENKDDEDNDDEEDGQIIIDDDEDMEYVADFSDAEDVLYDYLDVMYDPDSDEFEMWITEGEGIESLNDDELMTAMVVAYMLEGRDYLVLSGSYESDTDYSFEVQFGIADFYEAADIFMETLEPYSDEELESLTEDEIFALMLDCIEVAETAYYEINVLMSYDEDFGWHVLNEEQIIEMLVEDFQYAFDF